ncbi:ligase-associated DNA damage response endonuclease PdeM [Stappia indica]|uniref:ligase-associated DNA damage response endonuclease PdeM n=1 Tax=Stappia indica TaxID=538381 RepID=UPI001CD278EB|nr:ligase-associated DNA damage response endonuclease PdeM [Stappia indica]MCA1297952.1 ligase-associated DNA damage response endonuclease PdeM [Stappia indica]
MRSFSAQLQTRRFAPVCHDISIAGELVGLHDSGALWWPDGDTLIVTDLHFEKASSFARKGVMLPPYDTAATLEKLAEVIEAFQPRRVIALGDSFHDADGSDRLPASYRAMLTTLQLGREWIWVTGNHDPIAPIGLCGETAEEVALGGLVFRHEPRADAEPGEISGHLHPAARVRRYGRAVRRPCFATNGHRLVLPAFGVFTGGLNVLDEAWTEIFPTQAFSVFMLGEARLYPFTASRLVKD